MSYIAEITVFVFGIIIGSFLNVCIYRIPKEESIAYPPSHCGSCGHNLKVIDLVPIFSWLLLKGKCRYCGEKVSKQYPIVEGATGLLFVFLYLKFGFKPYSGIKPDNWDCCHMDFENYNNEAWELIWSKIK